MQSYDKVEELLKAIKTVSVGGRSIREVVLHHTYEPDHAQWNGDSSAAGILDYWKTITKEKGWKHHLGGHVLVAPSGKIFLPFGDFSEPLNANTNPDANQHGIAIETVGNFDTGHDVLEGAQKHAVMALISGLLVRFGLGEDRLFFHASYQHYKTCPGSGLNLSSFRAAIVPCADWVKGFNRGQVTPCPCCPK